MSAKYCTKTRTAKIFVSKQTTIFNDVTEETTVTKNYTQYYYSHDEFKMYLSSTHGKDGSYFYFVLPDDVQVSTTCFGSYDEEYYVVRNDEIFLYMEKLDLLNSITLS